jgi:hypothetical protein
MKLTSAILPDAAAVLCRFLSRRHSHRIFVQIGRFDFWLRGQPEEKTHPREANQLLSFEVAHDTALSDLWDAYEDELAGVLMPVFGELRRSVSRGERPRSRAAALAALEADLQVARRHDSTHDERLLAEWIGRLAE